MHAPQREHGVHAPAAMWPRLGRTAAPPMPLASPAAATAASPHTLSPSPSMWVLLRRLEYSSTAPRPAKSSTAARSICVADAVTTSSPTFIMALLSRSNSVGTSRSSSCEESGSRAGSAAAGDSWKWPCGEGV